MRTPEELIKAIVAEQGEIKDVFLTACGGSLVKNILPAMGNEFIQLIKETSILGYVGIVDLTKAASYVSSRTYKMFIPLLAAGIVYYLIVKLLSVFLRKFERRLKESD